MDCVLDFTHITQIISITASIIVFVYEFIAWYRNDTRINTVGQAIITGFCFIVYKLTGKMIPFSLNKSRVNSTLTLKKQLSRAPSVLTLRSVTPSNRTAGVATPSINRPLSDFSNELNNVHVKL